ncbi:MAG: hypothetical protein IKV92_02935 [Akkermansia sp.]|nr:hypothetical protein [Akkermansia sp.]
MKTLYLTLFVAVAMPCMADISIGTGRCRPVAADTSVAKPAAQPDAVAEKAALVEAIKQITDEKGAAAAQKQLSSQHAAVRDKAKKYDETVKKIDELGPQVEAQLQQDVSRVADVVQGKGLRTERDQKIHDILMQNIPESGYDTSSAHEIDACPARVPTAESSIPALRPLPQGVEL